MGIQKMRVHKWVTTINERPYHLTHTEIDEYNAVPESDKRIVRKKYNSQGELIFFRVEEKAIAGNMKGG